MAAYEDHEKTSHPYPKEGGGTARRPLGRTVPPATKNKGNYRRHSHCHRTGRCCNGQEKTAGIIDVNTYRLQRNMPKCTLNF